MSTIKRTYGYPCIAPESKQSSTYDDNEDQGVHKETFLKEGRLFASVLNQHEDFLKTLTLA